MWAFCSVAEQLAASEKDFCPNKLVVFSYEMLLSDCSVAPTSEIHMTAILILLTVGV
jgi:hypothetical protein